MTNNRSGKLAEFMALCWLGCKGYRLVARNYVTGRGTTAGEVDLIVRKKQMLVFVEVKKRQTIDAAAYAITPRQQQRIRRGAESFLKQNPFFRNFEIRFDAVLVKFPCTVEHIKNAWVD